MKPEVLTPCYKQKEVNLKIVNQIGSKDQGLQTLEPLHEVETLQDVDLVAIKKIDPLYKIKYYDADYDFSSGVKSFRLQDSELLAENILSEMFVLHSQSIGISSHLRLDNQKPLSAMYHSITLTIHKKVHFYETQSQEVNLPWDLPTVPQIDLFNLNNSLYAYAIYWQSGELIALQLVVSCGLAITQTGISIWLYATAKKGFCLFINYAIK